MRGLAELESDLAEAEPGPRHLWPPVLTAAGEMLAEVDDWQVLYGVHLIPLP